MSQNKVISLLALVLVVVVIGSIAVLWSTSDTTTPTDTSSAPATDLFSFDVLQRQDYQLLNKQLVREGALPVKPPVTPGKANPFL